MDLSIIIVNYNTKDLTMTCLASIMRFLNGKIGYETIVIDNGSCDGSQQAINEFIKGEKRFRLVKCDSNTGFSKANNTGIRQASGRQVLLLNSDTYLVDDSILKAVDYLDKNKNVFGCGCTLLNEDLTPGISYGRFPEFMTVLSEIACNKAGKYRAMTPENPEDIYNIDLPCGAFFLINRELLDRIGYLDERFFMYCEETDLARRAKKAGWSIVYYGPAKVVHLGGQSSKGGDKPDKSIKDAADVRKIFYRSWRAYLIKHHSRAYASAVKLMMLSYLNFLYIVFSYIRKNPAAVAELSAEISAISRGWKK
jgi:GT2 family glycosyltransferase